MTMVNENAYTNWIGRQAVDNSGHKVGKVSQVFLDDTTGAPEWISVKTGVLTNASSFVPLQGVRSEGDRVVLPFDKAMVKGAPAVDEDRDGHLDGQEERQLYRYYGRQWEEPSTESESTADTAAQDSGNEVGKTTLDGQIVGGDVGPTVPASHEELRVQDSSITSGFAGADDPAAGAGGSYEDSEVVVREERLVARKTTAPQGDSERGQR